MIRFYLKNSSVLFPNNFFLLSSSSKQQETSNGEDMIQVLLLSSGQKELSNLQSFCILALVILENIIHNSDEFNLSCVAPPPFISPTVSFRANLLTCPPLPQQPIRSFLHYRSMTSQQPGLGTSLKVLHG